MRNIKVPVYVGVMKSTEHDEIPVFCVTERPYSDPSGYHWYRTELDIPIQAEVTDVNSGRVEPISDDQ